MSAIFLCGTIEERTGDRGLPIIAYSKLPKGGVFGESCARGEWQSILSIETGKGQVIAVHLYLQYHRYMRGALHAARSPT